MTLMSPVSLLKCSTRFALALSVFTLVACGQGTTVDLSRGGSSSPGDVVGKPGDPANGGDQNNSGLPPVASSPVPAPVPQPPEPQNPPGGGSGTSPSSGVNTYRVACEDFARGGLTSHSSLASPTDFSENWYFAEPAPGQTTVSRADQNITAIEGVVLAKGADADHLNMIFAARREDALNSSTPKRIYTSEVDVIRHIGKVTEVGVSATPDAGASELATRLGLSLRSHGASEDGEFLLAPGAGATLQILSAQTGRAISALAIDPAKNFFPRLNGETLSVLEYDAKTKGFKNVFYKLSAKPGSKFALKTSLLSAPMTGGRTALGRAVVRGSERLWVEGDLKAVSGLTTLDVVRHDLATGKTETTKLTVTGKNTFAPSFAFFEKGGVLNVVVAEESVQAIARPQPRGPVAKVNEAKFVVSELLSGGRLGQVSQLQYPFRAISRIEHSGLGRKNHALMSLLTTPDLKEFMVVLPEEFGSHIFKLEGGRLSRVSQGACDNPDLIVEPAH